MEKSKQTTEAETKLLTVKQAAEQVGCAQQIIYVDIDKGLLKAFRIGSRRLIKPSDLDSYRLAYHPARPSAIRKRSQDEIVGLRLRQIRQYCTINPTTGEPYTQTEFAALLGTSQNSVKNWELSLRHIPPEFLRKYANIGKTTSDWILFGKGDPPKWLSPQPPGRS